MQINNWCKKNQQKSLLVNNNKKAFTLIELLLVIGLIGLIYSIHIHRTSSGSQTTRMKVATDMIMGLIELAQVTAKTTPAIENELLHSKSNIQKVTTRFLINIDENDSSSYLRSVAIIQGNSTQWQFIQPAIQLPAGVYIQLSTTSNINTMQLDLNTLSDNKGSTWTFCEFDTFGSLSSNCSYLQLFPGNILPGTIPPHISKTGPITQLYINPLGQVYKLDEVKEGPPPLKP